MIPIPKDHASTAARTLARISKSNRPIFQRFVTAKLACGVRPSSIANSLNALLILDRMTAPKRVRSLHPHDLSSALATYSATHSQNSSRTTSCHWAAFFAWAHGGVSPLDIRRALKRPRCATVKDVHPISDESFKRLLQAASLRSSPIKRARLHALLWTLWDSGFRASELSALRRSSVVFDDSGGATLTLPPDAPDLKTGPRSVYVIDAAGPLSVWMTTHPNAPADAPLFPAARNPCQPILTSALGKVLDILARQAGLIDLAIHPHLFRHSRATRAAASGWNEAQLNQFFGWESGGKMASHYVHLNALHMQERVRLDARLDPLGARIAADPKSAMADFASQVVSQTLAAIASSNARLALPSGAARDPSRDDDGAASPVARK